MNWLISRTLTTLIVLLTLACIGIFMYIRMHDTPADASQYQILKERWHARFKSTPTEAYTDFVREGDKLSYVESHWLAHIVGEVLFEKFGVSGMRFCTTDFSYGCYHGFSGSAFTAFGLGVVRDLADECPQSSPELFLGCMHGLGHGILAEVGSISLVKALQICSPLQEQEMIGGCLGGIFMEHNYNTLQSLEGLALRPYEKERAYEPCAQEVPDAYKAACYYELTSWWRASFDKQGMSQNEQYAEIGHLCRAIDDSEMQTVCFRGVGNVIGPLSGYNSTVMREWCSMMSDEHAQTVCFHESLGHLLQSDKGRAEIQSLCASGAVADTHLCRVE